MFKKPLIIGAGTMASGVAALFLSEGSNVTAIVRKVSKFDEVQSSIDKQVAKIKRRAAKQGKELPESGVLTLIADVTECDGTYDFIFEAITEDTASKISVQEKYQSCAGPDSIWATNTSSLSITELASNYKFKSNFVGVHFFNPVASMELVELIPGLSTSEETKQKVLQLIESLNKTAVLVEDSPGFIVNRLLIPMINEAVTLFESGVATKEEIDLAMKLGAHHPMGPLALADLIGNDVCLSIMQSLYQSTNDPKYRPAYLLKKMVYDGRLGRKSNEGFYEY
ncbi:3-hydroxyacyl-CoA dehydrogenase NAD-binding domain-containing protein [Pseudoalteromonas luteoviolacea]|uniref:3-hydroxyacyl-CoA dehydrogenase family protein n=1 Tax=Pseudoalteromonas luteoviolacea TaxID=43657 RepID=UPI001F2FE49E|nr:3-hydroxyacyl-CoA dehydrogenase NAD-binding domain-containing protein [Pseudoalteromonas luteoviolacea]MCF6439050.1 3-hydroxyacyl-CoA dehydrogenase NAD-binding domain-containing protein [Pseudoalteromonas luteoviolacea]